jgi:hypothetical protein
VITQLQWNQSNAVMTPVTLQAAVVMMLHSIQTSMRTTTRHLRSRRAKHILAM